MRHLFPPLRPAAASLLLGASLLSCGDAGGTGPDPAGEVVSVAVTPDSVEVPLGGTRQLGVVARNGRGEVVAVDVVWSTSDSGIATVDGGGVVRGMGPGRATVTASAGGRSAVARVVAFDPSPPAPPGDVRATPLSDTRVEVSWSDASSSETGFVVLRERVVQGVPAGAAAAFVEAGRVGPDETRFEDGGLIPDAAYRYAVQACAAVGCSEAAAAPDPVTTFPTLSVDVAGRLPDGRLGEAYDVAFEASGPPATWALVGGALPTGLGLSDGGRLAGTPGEGGDFAFEVVARGGGQSVVTELVLTVLRPPAPSTTDLPTGVRGALYSTRLQATGGDGAYAWSLRAGTLPPGISLAGDGGLGGVPTATGAFGFEVEVASGGLQTTVALELRVFDRLEVSTSTLPSAVVGTPYGEALGAVGGDGAYTWSLASGSLPAGTFLSAAGEVTGTPSVVGTFSFAVRVESGDGQSRDAALTWTVRERPVAPTVLTTDLPDGGVGAPYTATLVAGDGDGTYVWSAVGGLPPGLSLSSGGVVSGDPGASGTFAVTVEVASAGLTGAATLDLRIRPALTLSPAALPPGIRGGSYAAELSASGGDGAPAFTVVEGTLPPGIVLEPVTGWFAGIPTTAGGSDFTVEVRNALGQATRRGYRIDVWNALAVTGGALADGAAGVAYAAQLAATGGNGSYTWSVTAGSLPDGLGLAPATGLVSGTPSTLGTWTFTVQAVSGDGQVAAAERSLTVTTAPPAVVTTTLPPATLGAAYDATLTAAGGDGSYTWAVVGGALPAGLTLGTATGRITGTPTQAGTFVFTVEVTSDGRSSTRTLSLAVGGDPLALPRSRLPGGYLGQSYVGVAGPATGGDGAVSYAVTEGALPAGLSLDPASGIVAGTPTTPGMAFFRVTASAGAAQASRVFSITVSTAPPDGFNVFGLNVADVVPSAAVRTAIDAALARFEAAITADAPDLAFPASGLSAACSGNGALFHGGTLDDVEVVMNLAPIDGPSGILGQAGICLARSQGPPTAVSQLVLDTDDLNRLGPAATFALVWHELAHGFGLAEPAWVAYGLMTGANGPAPEYTGPAGVSQFQAVLGGAGFPPIEADGGEGTRDSHWDEGFFDNEIMTGFLDAGTNPISVLTVAALADLGWGGVDLGAADAYSLPSPSAPPGAPGADARIPLGDDVIRGPVWVLGPDGSVRRIDPPGGR